MTLVLEANSCSIEEMSIVLTDETTDANLEALMSMEDNTMAGEQSGYGADEYLDDMKIESPEDIEPEELLAAFD